MQLTVSIDNSDNVYFSYSFPGFWLAFPTAM